MLNKITKALFVLFTALFIGFTGLIIYKSSEILAGRISLSPYNNTTPTNLLNVDLDIAPNPIAKDKNGYTTILLVGVDTRANTRLFNTDTIMTLTYSWKDHQIYIISYPRDLYIKYPNTYYHFKINAVYAYGTRVFNTDGMKYLEKAIYDISGLTVQYHMLIDFKGFTDLINLLGGVKVNIPRSFTDYMYPTESGGYQTIHFDKGWHTLNADQALKFARSRHAQGPEGSDFARAYRQQLLIKAIADQVKEKVKKDPAWAFKTFQKMTTYVQASKVTPNEVKAGLEIFLEKGMPPMFSQVLTPATAKGTLLMSQANPLYIIIPRAGLDNWTYVKQFIKLYFAYPYTVTREPTIQVTYHTSGSANKALSNYKTLKNKFYWLTIYYPKYNKTQIEKTTILYKKSFKSVALELAKLLKIPSENIKEDKSISTSILINIK